jgi:hypothetical protein
LLKRDKKEAKVLVHFLQWAASMKSSNRISRFMYEFGRSESGTAHLAVGALLVVTILYATTII